MRFWVLGGGWVAAKNYGRAGDGPPPVFSDEVPVPPRARDLFDPALPRYGRFDSYTKLGCAAVALALADAGMQAFSGKGSVGIVSASCSDCFDTALASQETTLDQGGALASPNLFSYTLPGIVLGECAVHFGLAGPSASVGQSPKMGLGFAALDSALRFLDAGKAETMLAGWIEAPPSVGLSPDAYRPVAGPYGSLFAVIGLQRPAGSACPEGLWDSGTITLASTEKEITSLLDLF